MYSSWFHKTEFKCPTVDTREPVDSRQVDVEGWDQDKLKNSHVLFIGAGGISSWISLGLVLKGLGSMSFCDGDVVSPSNLTRQFYTEKNLYEPKAIELPKNLSEVGSMGTVLKGYPCWSKDLPEEVFLNSDVWVIGVDNQIANTKWDISHKAIELKKPAIFLGVSGDADYGYVFVQSPTLASLSFLLGYLGQNHENMCPGVPASADILIALAGHATYAVDTILMNRKRDWNYRTISMAHGRLVNSLFVTEED